MNEIRRQIEESIKVKKELLDNDEILKSISAAAEVCIVALKNGKKIMFAGNGGSAADAQHLAAELVNRFGFDRPAIAAIALTTDTSVLTAIANDYNFNILFSRQIESIGIDGDVLVALSTSGNSVNVLEAIKTAHGRGIATIGITGLSGGKMADICDILIKIPSYETPRIQETSILIGHILCYEIESSLFGKKE